MGPTYGVDVLSPAMFTLEELPGQSVSAFEVQPDANLELRAVAASDEVPIHSLLSRLQLTSSEIACLAAKRSEDISAQLFFRKLIWTMILSPFLRSLIASGGKCNSKSCGFVSSFTTPDL